MKRHESAGSVRAASRRQDFVLVDDIRYSPHPNGGGLVDLRARVDAAAYVGPNASVTGRAVLRGPVGVYDWATVAGDVELIGNVSLRHHARVSGRARIEGRVSLLNHAHVTGDADIEGTFNIDYFSVVGDGNRLRGFYVIGA